VEAVGQVEGVRARSPRVEAVKRRLQRLIVPAVLAGTLAALVLAVNPREFASSFARLDLRLVPVIIGLSVAFFVMQGLRWHILLAEVGARLRVRDSVLLNMAGQAITAILPLGDLTRAVFASQASRTEFGKVAATVTVQELAYTLILVLSATPVLLELKLGLGAVLAVVAVIAGILVILTVPPVFCFVHGVLARAPFLRGFLRQIDELHNQTVVLLHRADTLIWTILDAARASLAITVLWLIVIALHPGTFGWWQAAFVLALSYVGGAISLIPGGAGANEASMVGLLVLLHVDPATAAAAALLQRLFMTGLATLLGWGAYMVARRRFDLGPLLAVKPPSSPEPPPPPEPTLEVREAA
jgi:glycosyltransferase 2 family protein